MLSKKVFVDGINQLIVAYPNWKFDPENSTALKVWYSHFDYMDDERFLYMINAFIGYSKAYPTVAGLKECDTIPRKTKEEIEHEKMLREEGWL